MGTDYSPSNFLTKTPNDLLEQYLKSKEVEPQVEIEIEDKDGGKSKKTVKVSELKENQFQPILTLIESQVTTKKDEIEADFLKINERSCKAGFLCLLDEASYEGHNLSINGDLEDMKNHYERAMWVFLNYPKVFKNSGHFQKMDGVTFKKIMAWKGLVPKQDDDELKNFKQKVIGQYKNENRGKCCEITLLKRSMPERYCYFVKLQDYSDTLDQFKDKKLIQTQVTPAFQIIFVYHPDSGRIETNAKGKKDKINELYEAFCQGVLDKKKVPKQKEDMYNLEKLKTRFKFQPREIKDNIQTVKLKFIELKINNSRQIAFTDKGYSTDIYNLIDDALNKKKISLDTVKVTKAKIQIVFKRMADERKSKTVTIDIGLPNSCNLKDTPLHLIAQKYIEKWGLISDETIEKDDEPEDNQPEKKIA